MVDGLIGDCARLVSERKQKEGWFDASTLKEPFRLEGKKTMGYEVAEQFGWRLPQAIVYPCGGGVGLIGMWKAFDEMEALGWISAERPRMIAVQSAGCAPIVQAWKAGRATAEPWPNPETVAAGLRVPKPYGGSLILDILQQSRGAAVAVTDDEIMQALDHWARVEGCVRCARRRSVFGGLSPVVRPGIFPPQRHRGFVQHRCRLEVSGGD